MAEPFHRSETLRRKCRRWSSRRAVGSRAIIAVVIALVGGGITNLVQPIMATGGAPTDHGGLPNQASEILRLLSVPETRNPVVEVRSSGLATFETGFVSATALVPFSGKVSSATRNAEVKDSSRVAVSATSCVATPRPANVTGGLNCPQAHTAGGLARPDWGVATPTANPSSIDLGQSVNFTVVVTNKDKLTNFTFNWVELPTGCSSHNKTRLTCTPSAAGTFPVNVTVTLVNNSLNSGTLKFKVNADPTLTSFGASPSTLLVDTSTTFSVQESFGLSPFQYSYSGLPSGCTSKNAATFSCTPTQTGKFTVEVNFEDAAGLTAALNTTISVTPRVLGLAPLEGYAVIGGTVAFLALVVFILVIVRMRRRRLGKRPARDTSAPERTAPPVLPPSEGPEQKTPHPPDSP